MKSQLIKIMKTWSNEIGVTYARHFDTIKVAAQYSPIEEYSLEVKLISLYQYVSVVM